MFLEIALNSFAPYPFLDGITYVEDVKDFDAKATYEINDVFLILIFLRIYLLARFLLFLTQFNTPRAFRVCATNRCEATSFFAMKAVMK